MEHSDTENTGKCAMCGAEGKEGDMCCGKPMEKKCSACGNASSKCSCS